MLSRLFPGFLYTSLQRVHRAYRSHAVEAGVFDLYGDRLQQLPNLLRLLNMDCGGLYYVGEASKV